MRLSRRGKRRLLVLVIAAFALGGAIMAFSAIKRAQQRRMVAEARVEGLNAYRHGDLGVAIEKLSYYFTHEKDDLEANLIFAEARARVPLPGGRHLFDAVDLYSTHGLDLIGSHAVDDSAQRREILSRLLELYAQLGDRERVASTADELLKIDPALIPALAAQAEVHFLNREFVEAEVLANRLIELEPDSLTWRRMLLEVRGRQGASMFAQIEQCRIWSEQYTADARFRLLAAAMLVDAGRMEDARAELHAAGSLGANSREVLEQLIAILDILGLHQEADEALASAAGRFPDQWWPRETAVRRAWHRDETDAAMKLLASARAELTEEPPAMHRLEVVTLIAAGRRSDALAALEPLLRLSTADKSLDEYRRWAAAVSAVLSVERDEWRGASDELQAAIAAAPHDAVLQFLLGDVCKMAGEQTRAISAYQQAYSSSPNWMAAGVAYSRALLDAGRLDEAFNVARLTITRNGLERLQPFLQFVRCVLALRESGTPTEVIAGEDMLSDLAQAMVQVQSQFPGDAEIAALRARAHLAAGDEASATRFMSETLEASDATAGMLVELAEVSVQNDLPMHGDLLNRAREVGGLTLSVAFALADVAQRDGAPADGLAIIDRAIEAARLEPGSDEAEIKAARAAYLLRIHDPAALPSLLQIVREFSNSVDIQRFALAQTRAWTDQRLIAEAMGNLHRLLGDESIQVRLAEANFLLRFGSHDDGMVAKATATVQSVLEQSPDSLAALSLAAEAALMGDRPDLTRAAEYLSQAVNLYPGQPNLLVRLISTLQRQGRFDVAGRHLQSLAMLLQRHPEYAIEELRLLQAQGDFESALVRASARVDQSSPPSQQLLLAAVQERAGHVAEAEAVYERLLASDEPESLVLSQAAEFFASTGRYERGLELMERLTAESGAAARDVTIGSFQQRHGRLLEAGQSLRKAVETDPSNPAAFDELAKHYLTINQPAQAREQALAGLRIDGDHVGLRSTLAIANLALPGADRAGAIQLLREIGGTDDALLAMLELLERVPVLDGRAVPNAANLAASRQLTDSYGNFLPVWQMAMAMHLEAGRTNDAISIAREAVSRLPGEAAPAQWATQLLMRVGRWDEAMAEVQEWRRRSSADPVAADAAAARILLVRERSEEAAKIIAPHESSLLENRHRQPEHVLTLLESLVRTGQITHAERIISPLLEEHASWRAAWMDASEVMSPTDAERILRDIRERVTNSDERLALATAWLTLARRTGSDAHLVEAEELASPLASEASTAVGANIIIGAIAEARADLPRAETAYREAVRAGPQNAVALNNLAFVVSGQGRAAEALPLIKAALKLQADQPDLLDTYAHVLAGLNRLGEAESTLRRALQLRQNDAQLMLSLVDVLLRDGRRDDALLTLSQVERRAASLDAATLRRIGELRRRMEQTSSAVQTGNSIDTGRVANTSMP